MRLNTSLKRRLLYQSMPIWLILALIACGGTAATATPVPTPTEAPTLVPTPTSGPVSAVIPPPEFLNSAFEGEGPGTVGPVNVDVGVVIAFVRHSGEGPFSMTFKDDSGGSVNSVDQRPGPYSGERLHSVFEGNNEGLEPGLHTVEVDTVGPWRLRLLQDTPFNGAQLPITISGVGDGGGGWAEMPAGTYTVSSTHSGEQDFAVFLLDSKGRAPYEMAEGTGDYQAQDTLVLMNEGQSLAPVMIAVGVESQGEWEITITAEPVDPAPQS